MKIRFLFIFIFCFESYSQERKLSDYTCSFDKRAGGTILKCLDRKNRDSSGWALQSEDSSFTKKVHPLEAGDIKADLIDRGVEFIDSASFEIVSFFKTVDEINAQELAKNRLCPQKVSYKKNEFNQLDDEHPTIVRLRSLAKALKMAGVCELPIRKTKTKIDIDINNNDDLLEHFLCISNDESVFGRDNIGIGGRGPWGINPLHNEKKGSLCYQSQAVVRNKEGEEIKKSELYLNDEVRMDNAKCAFKLYLREDGNAGFTAWGTTSKWGSNRHCSRSDKKGFQFRKYLKAEACCSKACKEKANPSL